MGKKSFGIFQGLLVLGFWIVLATRPGSSFQASAALQVSPAKIVLDNPESTQQILVRSGKDVTRLATYQVVDAKIAVVDALGLIQPRSEGRTELVVRHGQGEVRVPIEVTGLKAPTPVSFQNQIMPILSKMNCNAGSCHGKAEGKNGFKLSVFGFDPEADYESLVKEARGRRLFPSSPDNSLLLRKASSKIAHGGGRRLDPDGLSYQRLRRWIVEGARYSDASDVSAIEVEPAQQILGFGDTQQLRVTAVDSKGKRYCVTLEAQYDSNAGSIAKVDGRGWIQASNIPGQAAILVRYLGHVTICRVTIPRTGERFTRPPESNFIDRLAWDHLGRLGIPPSDLADDTTFLRRVFLDSIGTLPTV
ncbi:MAG TPA: hypothetical protein VKE98_20850, partial [Gemmataceae bacterium]|nr:hypothetical protein [Gemmataceae bacterium]